MWIHPVDREDAPAEIKLLGKAWLAVMMAQGAYGEEASPVPAWAEEVFAAAEAALGLGPIDRAECMTAAWQAEKNAAYQAANEARQAAKAHREKLVAELVAARDVAGLIKAEVTRMEMGEFGLRTRLLYGRGDKVIGIGG